MQTHLVILAVFLLLIISIINTFFIKPSQNLLKRLRLGCGPMPFEPAQWLVGINTVRCELQADKEQRTPDYMASRFEAMGRYTWRLSVLGVSNLITAEPRNVQALLATELNKCIETFHALVDNVIDATDQARKSGSSQLRYDFVETLRTCCSDCAEVREQVLGLLAVGRDTTASLTAWVFYCLVRNLRVYEKLRKNFLADFGPYHTKVGQTITFEKLKGCAYLQHILRETLRLHSAVPFDSRCTARNTTLLVGGGPDGSMPVFVPKGTEVNFSTYVLHRRKDLWGEDANEFVPERWEKRRPGTTWQYIPFNRGPRIYIGHQFALTEAGSVTRIAPDELSYASSTALKKIDGTTPPREFLKCLDGRGIAPAIVNGRRRIVIEMLMSPGSKSSARGSRLSFGISSLCTTTSNGF
ncbi:unspecific monooxygenase [Alternaria panax]|uniref:Unspecific monooxygenase n=1 Tax=Alternaria panax TaxID=48097 RepID=A0AAD4FH99_9PLEO|nr:unspecific monooxygenase [Alternaria panax]